jgi:hypothetical protein
MEHRSKLGQLQQMRLPHVPIIHAINRTSAPLLPLPRFRWLATLDGPLCDSRPGRQDLLDHIVWNEIIKLLEDPSMIQS